MKGLVGSTKSQIRRAYINENLADRIVAVNELTATIQLKVIYRYLTFNELRVSKLHGHFIGLFSFSFVKFVEKYILKRILCFVKVTLITVNRLGFAKLALFDLFCKLGNSKNVQLVVFAVARVFVFR